MFKRSQTVLKKILSPKSFNIVYNFAWRSFLVWTDFSDFWHFRLGYIIAKLRGEREKATQMKIMYTVKNQTMVGRSGMYITYESVAEIEKKKLSGCIVECGVARGGSSGLMALTSFHFGSSRKFWLFDTFEGLPAPSSEDNHTDPVYVTSNKRASRVVEGFCLGTIEEVETFLFSKLKLPPQRFYLIKGLFQNTLPAYKDKIGPISVLRLDGDWYESTKCCLENLYDNVVPDGHVILDDYNSVPGCKKATDEFLFNRGISVDIQFDDRGGCRFVKP